MSEITERTACCPAAPDDPLDLTDRRIVVTGAAAGIGRATARLLASRGAHVIGIDRDGSALSSLVDELGCSYVVGDVREHEAIARLVEVAGDVDAVVNNAGGGFRAMFADLSPKGDETLLRENLLSAVWVTRALLPRLRDGGSIVFVTSIEAHRAAPGFSLYAAAKGALDQLVRTLALELGDRGIRVNAVAPDVTVTPGVGALERATSAGLGRVASADEVAGPILFLVSGLSSFVTGSTVNVDGGNLAAAGWRRAGESWAT